MKTVTRRELNHSLARVLDTVAATGEAVEIVTRGGRPLVIAPKAETVYESWVRQGLVTDTPTDVAVLDSVRAATSPVTTAELLDDIRGDRA